MTMKELATIVGVTEAAISHYETGRREPDPDMLSRIATALNVSVDFLIGRDEKEEQEYKPKRSERANQILKETEDLSDSEFELVRMFLKQVKKNRE